MKPAIFEPSCLATAIGSLPHRDAEAGTRLILRHTPQIPGWAQFPKRDPLENMMVQFTEGIPGLTREGDKRYFNSESRDFTEELTAFYTSFLEATDGNDKHALERAALSPAYATGFQIFLDRLQEYPKEAVLAKGQVTGPFTLGFNLTDQNGKAAYFDDQLRDVLVKATALNAMWQVHRLKSLCPRVFICVDEPALLNFGTQICLTVTRQDVISDLNEMADLIHRSGAFVGIHCEENTDWSMLMESDLDILIFDAYDHMRSITLYPEELKKFLEKGGSLGWGIVPTLDQEAAANETFTSLLDRYGKGMEQLAALGFHEELLHRRTLLTPSCGCGGVLTESLAERVLDLLRQISTHLRSVYGFTDTTACFPGPEY
jgi:hypothetical protein